MDFDSKVPSAVPQDLLLIQDLIGTRLPLTVVEKRAPDSPGFSDDSIASTDGEAESEDEVEAGLASRDDDSEMSATTSDSVWPSGSESDADSSSGSEAEHGYAAPQPQRPLDDVEDEDSGVTATTTYLQTKNEIVDASITVPTISEIGPCDTLEKVGEIMSIVGNVVIVKGLPADHVDSPSGRALDAESLLVFEDRKVLGYVYETFGPTSQPLYQVRFNQHYPLDTDKIWLSRGVFHVPQRSHFVFVDKLKNLRGSDASNIHDEEPADDEIEFSDDEKEAAFRAQRKRRRAHSVSSRCSPASSRIHIDDMGHDAYCGANPYDAHGPYDDDYHVTRLLRPPPIPYDDPYADAPTSNARVCNMEMNDEFLGQSNCGSGRGSKGFRGRSSDRSTRGRGARDHQSWGTSRRGYRHKPAASRRTFDPDIDQSFPAGLRTREYATGYGQIGDAIEASHSPVQPTSNAWFSPETNNIQGFGQPFIQPHINPRFASVFGLDLPSAPMIPWVSQNINTPDHTVPPSSHWVNTWTVHSKAGAEGEGDSYRPM